MKAIADAYYSAEPDIMGADAIFDDLFGDLSKIELQSLFRDSQTFRSYISAKSRLDFTTGNTRVLEGIYFSLTELKVCALACPSRSVGRS